MNQPDTRIALMIDPITPEQFVLAMRRIAKGVDLETEHSAADMLMCSLLTALGYEEGIAVYLFMKRWYS